jgi:tetratricopeptide (TPR) repeat protein
MQGDYERATTASLDALSRYRQMGDKTGTGKALYYLGGIGIIKMDFPMAEEHLTEGLQIGRELGNSELVVSCLNGLGLTKHYTGQYDEALPLYMEALEQGRQTSIELQGAYIIGNVGKLMLTMGRYDESYSWLSESLTYYRGPGLKVGIAESLSDFAQLAAAEGQHERAARLFGASEGLREAIGAPVPPIAVEDQQAGIGRARSALGDKAYETFRAEGRAMTLDQAMDYALARTSAIRV